jgi:hypothetical protein
MLLLVLVAAGLVIGLGVALLVGGARRRVLGVAFAGCVLWAVWSLYALGAGCDPGRECNAALSALVGAFVLLGWLLGVGLAALVRRAGAVERRAVAVVAGLTLLATTAVVYERYGFNIARWGCPTDEELKRTQSVEEVVDAFENHDLALERIPFPVWLPKTEPAYRDARVLRHATLRATAYLIVCRRQCAISRFRFAEAREVGEQRWYMGLIPGNNVPMFVTEAGRGDGRRLLEAIEPARREIHPSIEYGSRCYIN